MIHVGFCLLLVTARLVHPSLSYPDDYDDSQQSSDDAVSIYWGIADRDAVVGRLFQCKIPPERDAFKGTIVEYDVSHSFLADFEFVAVSIYSKLSNMTSG
jgi:hypothetical protein